MILCGESCVKISTDVLSLKLVLWPSVVIALDLRACLCNDKLLSVLCTFAVSQCGQTARRDQLRRVCGRAPGQRLGQPQRGEFTGSSACFKSASAVSACIKPNMGFI